MSGQTCYYRPARWDLHNHRKRPQELQRLLTRGKPGRCDLKMRDGLSRIARALKPIWQPSM